MNAGKEVIEFSGIMPNPTYKKVLEGAELVRRTHVDLILGVGGGSVMDCCKAISMAAVYDGDLWSDYWEKRGIVYFKPISLGVIVTLAGTGSEMNGGAVITNEDKNIKTGMDYPECNPKFALMDPEYTMSVPKLQTAAGGNCTVVNLPDEGMSGNSHFLFQELNNAQIADHLEKWIRENVK